MALILIGLGLYGDENKERILKYVESADVIYIERYTSPLGSIPSYILEAGGDKVVLVSRKDLEEGGSEVVEEALNKNVVVITPGNPMIATTHSYLIIEARKMGVKTEIVHGTSSICAAIAESGLHIYKLGGVSTVVRGEKASVDRVLKIIRDNLMRGLHTLLLLEYASDEDYMMSPPEAINILLERDSEGVLSPSRMVVVLCNLGREDMRICVSTIGELASMPSTGDDWGTCILIIPGELHFMEREYLDILNRC